MHTSHTQTRLTTWQDLAALPEAPQMPPEPVFGDSTELDRFSSVICGVGLEGVWKGSGRPVALLRGLQDAGAVREAIGLSQNQMGELVARLMDRAQAFTKNSVSAWEWWARNAGNTRGPARQAMTKKYAPTAEVVAVYVALVNHLMRVSTKGCLGIRAQASRARPAWRFELVLGCRTCGRAFVPERDRIVNCKRCR